MASIDYSDLYALQDKVLATIFAEDTSFYLTAGTCLHRFYLDAIGGNIIRRAKSQARTERRAGYAKCGQPSPGQNKQQ